MKELSIEEKAERYDEVIAMAKECITYIPDKAVNKYMLDMFPELKGSEDDRIRKQIISFLKEFEHDHYRCLDFSSLIAWLEKQGQSKKNSIWKHWKDGIAGNGDGIPVFLIKIGLTYSLSSCLSFECDYIELSELDNLMLEKKDEQKPIDAVEPRFKTRQWIVWQDKCYKVNYNGCGYELVDQNGLSTSLEYGTIDENAHLWTIKDAKEGDVLVSDSNQPFIYNGIYTDFVVGAHIGISFDGEELFATKTNNWTKTKGVKPATKEQRDCLFQRIKEDGYEWNADTKVLNKVTIYE